jgi:hypothetical protein
VRAHGEPPFTRPVSAPSAPRSRVLIVQHDAATDAFKAQPEVVRRLVQRGITNFTGHTDVGTAWRAIVSPQEIVGIKVHSSPGPHTGTRPAVVAGVVQGLLAAKIPTNHIIIWDRELADLRHAGFDELAAQYRVRLAGALDTGWDETNSYDSALLGNLVYGDLEFEKKGERVGRKSFVSRLLTKQITKIINVSPMLNHNAVGVCGNLYGLASGSVDNFMRFEGDGAKLAEAVPDIYNLPALGERVALNIVDALVCQYKGQQIARLHNSIALNELRFSSDPVALDVLSIQEITTQRGRSESPSGVHTNRLDVYLNAVLLELGSADVQRIDVQTVKIAD